MDKIYHVIIKGRTLESRDLRELLARAVSEKRNLDRKVHLQSRVQERATCGNASARMRPQVGSPFFEGEKNDLLVTIRADPVQL